jgi:hypothetical protein
MEKVLSILSFLPCKRWENHNIITVIVHGYHLVNAFRIYLTVIVTNIIAVIFHRRYP